MNKCVVDAKGINLLNLVRIGILKGKGTILFTAAKFQRDCFLLDDAEINAMYTKLLGHISTLPHGPFQAIAMVLGTEEAKNQAIRRKECQLPGCYLNVSSSSRVADGKTFGRQEGDGTEDLDLPTSNNVEREHNSELDTEIGDDVFDSSFSF